MSFALLAAALASPVLSGCGEKHDVLGSRADAGTGPGGTGGGAGSETSDTGGAGRSGGSGAGGSAAAGGAEGGGAHGGTQGGGGGDALGGGSGEAGAGAGGFAGASAGASGEGGSSTGGGAGSASGGTAGSSPECPSACVPSAGNCASGEVSWLCSAGFDDDEFVDAGCTDQATGLERFCCPPAFYAGCEPCAELTTLESCEARPDCHSVFTDPGPENCTCTAVGCCTRFARCAEGGFANCIGPVACTGLLPYCPEPAYVVSTADGCYEGCVKPEDCAIASHAPDTFEDTDN